MFCFTDLLEIYFVVFLFLIDNFMARNPCCISPVTTKSVLMWVFLCLPEHSSESFVLIANLCWGSGVDIFLPSTQLHCGTQANFPLLTVPQKLNISVVD